MQKVLKGFGDNFFDRCSYFAGHQFVFGLRGEFGLGHFDGEHAGQSLTHVVTGGFDLGFFGGFAYFDVFVDHAGHRGAHAG